MTYPHNETGAEVEQAYFGAEAEVIEGSRGDCRETLAYLLGIGSELMRNGIQHTTGEAIELVRLAMARTWGWPRRERQQANAVDFLRALGIAAIEFPDDFAKSGRA